MRTQTPKAKEFRRGVGRARVLMRSELGLLTGSPVGASANSGDHCVQWLMVPQTPGHEFQAVMTGAEKLRTMEQSLNQLVMYHRTHLSKLVPKPES